MQTYIEHFMRLRSEVRPGRWPAITRGRAPHKPLLLLAVIDCIASGAIDENLFAIDDALFAVFGRLWLAIMETPATRANISVPAYHLQHDGGFWQLVPRSNIEQLHEDVKRATSFPLLNQLVMGVRLDNDLFGLLLDQEARSRLRHLIVETYFTPEAWERLAPATDIPT